MKKWFSAILAMVLAFTCSATALAADATVPANVTPTKSYTATLGITYRLPDDAKQAGDTYATSNSGILTVNKDSGNFTPVASGAAYIVATNGTQKRYIKVTVGTTTQTASGAAVNNAGVFAGYKVTVLDKTTPAVDAYGDGSFVKYTFYDASGKAVGSISGDDMLAILQKNQKAGVAPYDNYTPWYCEQFNKLRGLEKDASATTPAPVPTASNAIVDLINKERVAAGLSELAIDPELVELAKVRAEETALLNSHTRPDGTTVVDLGCGENLHSGGSIASDVVSSWMDSSGHRDNILLERYQYAGAAYYKPAQGNYRWVVIFSA